MEIKKGKKSQIGELKKKLQEAEKLKQEYLAGWQRARADFLNYKKQEIERITEFLKYGQEELILKILPILDSFDKAKIEMSKADNLDKKLADGILLIKKQFQDFLKSQGLEEIESKGKKFDPNFHEAIEEIENSSQEPGTIIEEIQKGYKLHNKVIRPAKVKISK